MIILQIQFLLEPLEILEIPPKFLVNLHVPIDSVNLHMKVSIGEKNSNALDFSNQPHRISFMPQPQTGDMNRNLAIQADSAL